MAMSVQDPGDLTRLLNAAARGDSEANDAVAPRIYEELRRLARWNMSRLPGSATLQATALVHEAWIRLVDDEEPTWEGRRHFFFSAARAMRDILIDHARRRGAIKRGGGRRQVELEDQHLVIDVPMENLLDLDRALGRLEARDPEAGQLVMLRFFAGLDMETTARTLGLPLRTAERKWRFARSWLRRDLAAPAEG